MTDSELAAERFVSSDIDKAEEESGAAERRLTKAEQYSTPQLRKIFYVAVLGFAIVSGAFSGISDLQNTVNIETDLGTISELAGSISSVLFCFLVLPTLLDIYGPKIILIVCYIVSGISLLSNLYPTWFTLLPAEALLDICDTAYWVTIAVIITFVEDHRTRSHNLEDHSDMISQYWGKFYAIFSLGEILGSGISFAVLTAMNENYETLETLGGDNDWYLEFNLTEEEYLSTCVGNDCQEDYIYDSENYGLYESRWESIYVLTGIFFLMHIGSAIMQCVFLPRIPAKFDNEKKRPKFCKAIQMEIKKTVTYFVSLQNLLIFPSSIYIGLNMGYYILEYNRAYVSCVVGEKYIALFSVINRVSGLTSAAIASYFAPKVGRIPVYLTAVAIDVVYMVTGLMWHPTSSEFHVLIMLSIMNGFTDGIWMIDISTITYTFAGDNVAIGFVIQYAAINIAFVISLSWSVPLCVYEKLYILLSLLAISTLAWAVAEIRYRRGRKVDVADHNQEEMKDVVTSPE